MSMLVDLLNILGQIKTDPLTFEYKLGFMHKKARIIKLHTTNDEAISIEILMVFYSYALSFFAEKENLAECLEPAFLPSNEKQIPNTKTYKDILDTFYEGWKQLKKCDRNYLNLSKSYCEMKAEMPEIHQLGLQSVLLVLEANANFFYILIMKLKGDRWDKIARAAKSNSLKLKQAETYLNQF